MANLRVTHSRKALDGDIVALCGNWVPNSSVSKAQAIYDIENRIHRYYVLMQNGAAVDVHVVQGLHGKHLRTDPDGSGVNNLDYLPSC